ncbi:MAG: (Fe-S)-binding protein [Anaerolineae bacterium]|nr:(Fe-S)-binding protein [Anaerolineae bacterium]
MALPDRKSPIGKKVSLFVTCIIDMVYPNTGMSTVTVLEHLGCQVDFPMAQTCCGQPAFNSGYRDAAREVAIQFLKAFADAEVIVTPSGSCAAMVRHEYPVLFAEDEQWRTAAEEAASKTWELTEFIVDGLGITDLNGRLTQPTPVAFHDGCHGLRLLGLTNQGRTLVSGIENANVMEMDGCNECCGFGGLFSVKMADVSGAMLQQKMKQIEACSAESILTGDASCLMHINGGFEKQNRQPPVRHIADLLAEAVAGEPAHAD